MKIEFDGYVVEIKAKRNGEERMNQTATMAVINTLSSWAFDAAEHLQERGCRVIHKAAKEAANAMYEVLDSKGYYDGLKIYH